VWFVHGAVDWLWQFAGLSILGIGLLALSMRASDEQEPLPAASSPSAVVRSLVAIATLAAALTLAVPGAAARYERSGFDHQRSDGARALRDLERAASLNPLSASPLIAYAVIARTRGGRRDAGAKLREAIDREAENWFAHFELALLEGESRAWPAAERAIAEARRLNPHQPLVEEVAIRIRRRGRIDAAAVEHELRGQLSARLTPFEGA
jgi:tetratricopeptide (TPR) repeat protein